MAGPLPSGPIPTLAYATTGRTRRPSAVLAFVRAQPVGAVSLVFIAILLFGSIFAPWIVPHDPLALDFGALLEAPSWTHPFGTDNLGRDYLSRTLYGAQVSLIIGLAVMAISGVIGTAMGLAAGYFGGRVDMAITFVTTTRLALPVVLVALAVVAMVGGSLLVVILVLGLLKWDRFAVVMRSATQQVRSLDYVAAAEAAGGKLMVPVFEVPMVGRIAILQDPPGAVIGWMKPADRPPA